MTSLEILIDDMSDDGYSDKKRDEAGLWTAVNAAYRRIMKLYSV
jgi:hypothetical protein